MLTGGAFANATLFAMGITPYINSSIIIQLLTVAIPALERMAKEGEEGRKKIAAIIEIHHGGSRPHSGDRLLFLPEKQ